MKRRNFLFLQGPCTPFFAALADHLASLGYQVFRINFCGGDTLYWGQRPSIRYRGKPEELDTFISDIYKQYGITDQILFGDRRPVHRPAVEKAKQHGVRTHVFEEGYFRPYWITLEREGTNAHSLLPRDTQWFYRAGQRIPEQSKPTPFQSSLKVRAIHDIAYHIASIVNPFLFSEYRTHADNIAPIEYLGYIKRFSKLKFFKQREQSREHSLINSDKPYFLLPLQLNGDAQIRDHSSFAHMGDVMEHVLSSFSRSAPEDTILVIKNHPLDMGLMNYDRLLRKLEKQFHVENRIVYLETGNLTSLINHAKGVITVNSTTGFVSLELGVPTFCLSDPLYHLPGLTYQGTLDDFWTMHTPPDREFFECFQKVVLYSVQINGGFYSADGISLAVENASRVLLSEHSPLEEIL